MFRALLPLLLVTALAAQATTRPAKPYPPEGIGSIRVPVAVVIYNPVLEAEGGRKLTEVLRWQDPDRLTERLVRVTREASAGFVNYEVVARIEVDACPPFVSGFRYDDAGILQAVRTQKWIQGDRASYAAIFAENGIRELIRTKDVREVWLWGSPGFHWDEYAMHIPDRDRRLPPTENPWFYRPYDIPDVGRTIWVMGFSYERGEGEMLESYGHRVEGILSLAIAGGVWDTKRDDPWNRFTRVDKDHPGGSHVGSVHYAPNSKSDYDWGNPRYVSTYALDWRHYPDLKGTQVIMNCYDGWGPDIAVHHRWWLSLLPKAPGKTRHGWNNWWIYIADFDRSGL
ncbi:MAG: hypothetical protein IT458_12135 [Planctomycetes bacterium]|nr:hypothetical protein [Planctomycetota bacterium]